MDYGVVKCGSRQSLEVLKWARANCAARTTRSVDDASVDVLSGLSDDDNTDDDLSDASVPSAANTTHASCHAGRLINL